MKISGSICPRVPKIGLFINFSGQCKVHINIVAVLPARKSDSSLSLIKSLSFNNSYISSGLRPTTSGISNSFSPSNRQRIIAYTNTHSLLTRNMEYLAQYQRIYDSELDLFCISLIYGNRGIVDLQSI